MERQRTHTDILLTRFVAVLLVLCLLVVLGAGCSKQSTEEEADTTAEEKVVMTSNLPKVDNTKWNYEEEDNVYWQVGLSYCETPADETYETLGLFVPGDYFEGTKNEDGTYTCQITDNKVNGFTATTAPVVLPVETPGYAAMAAPTEYTDVTDYTDAGFVYLFAGCRGRDAGSPAGVTDLKAAIRYYRYQEDNVPGNPDRVFSFGMSGGGAQSALIGATGNSDLYEPYLKEIGAVEGASDAVTGSMCWCPITSLDTADAAYEWNLGSTRSDLTEEEQRISNALAKSYPGTINALKLKDEKGNVLTLKKSDEGIYQAGSYYDYLVNVVETSLNNFLSDTEFPYTPSSGKEMTNDGIQRTGGTGGPGGTGMPNGQKPDGNFGGGLMGGSTEDSTTYESVEDYIASLNKDTNWVTYDSKTNTATINGLADFVASQKNASKSLGAFDQLDRGQGENTLFGYDGEGGHFDATLADIMKGTDYESAFTEDFAKKDSAGNTVDVRLNMYTPLYYLNDTYEGNGSSDVADFWRIRTGIKQGDTALCTEVNLALALQNAGKNVDFATVWGLGHTKAERTGTSTENFIQWVQDCLQ